jgi:hypothetical protein
MRLVACLTVCVIPVVANAAQTESQPPSDPEAYCVNRGADFYPYTEEPCKTGYQLGSGNCRKADGHWAAVPKGTVYCDGRHCRIAVRTRTGAAVYAGPAKATASINARPTPCLRCSPASRAATSSHRLIRWPVGRGARRALRLQNEQPKADWPYF